MRALHLALILAASLPGDARALVDRNDAFIGYSEASASHAADDCVVPDDTNEACRGWALSGECEKNPAYMRRSCARSCDVPCVPKLGPRQRDVPGGGTVVLHTSEGVIRVRLRDDISPVVAGYFKSFAVEGKCAEAGDGCTFYRSEAVPEPGAIDNFGGPGPPYALVQGKMAGPDVRSDLPKEGAPEAERGHAALIGSGPDFFIAVKGHPEWGNAHTIWGEVAEEDMGPVDAITKLPVTKQVWGQTHVTVLRDPLPFRMTYEPPKANQQGALRGRA